jgi:hypothetical protein
LHKSVKKEKKLISEEEDQQYIVEHTAKKDKQFDLIDFLDYLYKSLSDKSIKIIKLIFDPKVNIKNILNKNYTYNAYGSKLTKDAIKKYLLKKGWKDNDIRNCFKEIRFALKEWEYVR